LIKLAKILQINDACVTLKLEQKTQCYDCKSQCSDGFLGFLFHKYDKDKLVVALNSKNKEEYHLEDSHAFFAGEHKVDEIIGVSFNEMYLLKLSMILYGLPIILIVLSLTAAYFLFNWLALNADLGGVLGLITGLVLTKYVIKINHSRFKPKVTFFK